MGSSNKSALRKRIVYTPLAALSALSLAVGAFVVPSFIAGDSATAATLTGGIRDKGGAVEKGAQQASDLPAGSCVVEGGEKSGS